MLGQQPLKLRNERLVFAAKAGDHRRQEGLTINSLKVEGVHRPQTQQVQEC